MNADRPEEKLVPEAQPAGTADASGGGSSPAVMIAGALALAAAVLPGRANAQTSPADGGPNAMDVMTMNALLTAEYNAIGAYTAGAAYLAMPASSDPLASAAPTVLAVAAHFRSQHRDHANQLVARITSAGGRPVAEADVMFRAPMGFTASVANILKLATNAEKAAAIAYADTLKVFSDAPTARFAAAVSGTEAQHFVVLYSLTKQLIAATAMTMPNAADVVPRSFVTTPDMPSATADGGAQPMPPGLDMLPDFTFGA